MTPIEPTVKKAIVFVDGQNLYYAAKESIKPTGLKLISRLTILVQTQTIIANLYSFRNKLTLIKPLKRGNWYIEYYVYGKRKREKIGTGKVKSALIKVNKHPDSQFIFCNKNGKPFYNVRKSFSTALKKSGIIDFRFHDLRHTFASQLVMSIGILK